MRIVKVNFADFDDYHNITVGKKLSFSLLQCDGMQWGIVGLGLSRRERELFNSKFFQLRNNVNFYLGKLIISYSRDECLNYLPHVVYDMSLITWIKMRMRHYYRYKIVPAIEFLINKMLHTIKFKKQFRFIVCKAYSGYVKVETDMLTAF